MSNVIAARLDLELVTDDGELHSWDWPQEWPFVHCGVKGCPVTIGLLRDEVRSDRHLAFSVSYFPGFTDDGTEGCVSLSARQRKRWEAAKRRRIAWPTFVSTSSHDTPDADDRPSDGRFRGRKRVDRFGTGFLSALPENFIYPASIPFRCPLHPGLRNVVKLPEVVLCECGRLHQTAAPPCDGAVATSAAAAWLAAEKARND